MPTVLDVDATWVNPNTVTLDAGELRRADAAAFAGRGDTYGAAGGIVRQWDDALAITVDGSDNITIQPGSVVIPGDAVAGTGVYRAGISAAQTHALDARDATNPRIDLVVFRQLDTDVVGTHGAYTARLEILTGVAAASPAAPALPSMAVELARISIPASGGGAATVDSTHRTFAAGIGGRLEVPTSARLPAAAAKWQKAIALDTGVEYTWSGTAWIMTGTVAAAADLFTGSEGAIVGSAPPAGTRKIIKQGTVIPTTNAAGGFNVPYHNGAFLNGVVSFVLTPGDNSAGFIFATPILANCTLAAWNGVAYKVNGTAIAVIVSTAIRANYIAIGW